MSKKYPQGVINLHTAFVNSPLGQKLSSTRIATAGIVETEERGKLHFVRLMTQARPGTLPETIEFYSKDETFAEIVAVVVYDGHKPSKTYYLVKPSNTQEFMAEIRQKSHLTENFSAITALVTTLVSIVSLLFMGKWVIEKWKASRDERKAKVDAEERLNAFLFQNQSAETPAFESYKSVVMNLKSMLHGNARGFIIYGMPGTGKTYIVRRTFHFENLRPDKDYVIVKGAAASADHNTKIIYSTMYEYNGKVIVFDDFDSALEDSNVINLLKAALDSYPVRIISMPDLGQYSVKDQPLPSRFEFTGKIVLITNKKTIDTALMSRAKSAALNFSPEEFNRNIGEMLEYVNPEVELSVKEEVYKFLQDSIAKNPDVTIDYRRFSSMIDLRLAYPDEWKELSAAVIYPPKTGISGQKGFY